MSGMVHWKVAVPKNYVIFDEGDAVEAIYRVTSGCVRLQLNNEEGGRQIFAFLFPGDIFGVAINGRRPASAEAVVASVITRYPTNSVETLLAHRPDLADDVLNACCQLASDVAHHLALVAHAPADERVLSFLKWMAEDAYDHGGAVDLPMSRRDIADYLALAPETLSRAFAKLETDGVFRCDGHRRVVFPSHTDGWPAPARRAHA